MVRGVAVLAGIGLTARKKNSAGAVVPQLSAIGYQVLFLSTDQPKLLYSSLKERRVCPKRQ